MKTYVLLLFLLPLLLLHCDVVDEITDPTQEEEKEELAPGTKSVEVAIMLPTNSAYTTEQLTISSLLDEAKNGELPVFEEDGTEVAYATNPDGNIVLLNYFNPIDGSIVKKENH